MKLNVSLTNEKTKKGYDLFFVEFPSGLKVAVKLCNANYKLVYKVKKEIERQ